LVPGQAASGKPSLTALAAGELGRSVAQIHIVKMMKQISLLVLIFLAIFIACSNHKKYQGLKGVALEVFDFGKLGPPTRDDRHLPQTLRPDLVQEILSFLRKHGRPAEIIAAARYHDEFLLLDVPYPGVDDASTFYVYSLKKGQIVGVFGWYIQG
jgi:hypothetical protein